MKVIFYIVFFLSFFIIPINNRLIINLMAQEKPAEEPTVETKDMQQQEVTDQVEAIKNKLKDLEERIKKSINNENKVVAQQYGVTIEELKNRTKILQEIQNTYEQTLDAIQRKQEYNNEEKELKVLQTKKYPEKPPYSLSHYDDFLVELSKSIQEVEAAKKSVEMFEKLLEDAESSLEESKQNVIALKDKIENNQDETKILNLMWNLEKKQLNKELAEATVKLHKTNLEAAEKNYEIAEMEVAVKRSQKEWIKNRLHFDKEDLSNQIEVINKRKDDILSKIDEYRKIKKQSEKKLIENKKRLYRVKNDKVYAVVNAKIETNQLKNNIYETKIGQADTIIQLLTQQENLWRKRYDLIKQKVKYKKLKTMESEAKTALDMIVKNTSLAQDKQINLQIQIDEIEKKIARPNQGSEMVNILKEQKNIYMEAAEFTFQYMTVLQSTKHMYNSFLDEISHKKEKVNLYQKICVVVKDFSNKTFLSNTVLNYLIAIIIFNLGFLFIKILKKFIFRYLHKLAARSSYTIDNCLIINIEKTLIPILYFGTFYLSLRTLNLNPLFSKMLNVAGVAVLTFFVIRFFIALITFFLNEYWLKKKENERYQSSFKALLPIIKVVFWSIGAFFLLDNLGFKISTVIASLGIGGIAIALASQNILGDLFNYFVILFDRPFEIGDFIIINEYLGSIEHIGIKTTRIRSLSGEQLIFSNTTLTGSKVRNYKRMERRRVVFTIGVIYQTSLENLKEIPIIIKDIINGIEEAAFDRSHFFSFGDFSLNIETVYYVLGNDYTKYMNVQQQINLSIVEALRERGIEFAYPTQLLYLKTIQPEGEPKKDTAILTIPGS